MPTPTVVRALSTGQPVVIAHVTPEILDAQRFGPKAREAFSALAPACWMAIPLVARDTTLGAMVLASADMDRRYGPRELRVAQLLADRAALAAQNALLFRKEHDALATRDEVLAIVSHDLRNPLHSIGMSVQLLPDVLGDEAQRRRLLQIIVRATNRMDRLIQDLLDVARIRSGKALAIEIRQEPMLPLVEEVCQQFVESAREKNVRLEWSVPANAPDVMIDRGVSNLHLPRAVCRNVCTPPGDGRTQDEVAKGNGGFVKSQSCLSESEADERKCAQFETRARALTDLFAPE
jgi:signal transduction histidine kinase